MALRRELGEELGELAGMGADIEARSPSGGITRRSSGTQRAVMLLEDRLEEMGEEAGVRRKRIRALPRLRSSHRFPQPLVELVEELRSW